MKFNWRGWYCRITIKDKKRSWIGAAYLWPFVIVEDEHSDGIDGAREKETEKHERDHLKQQLELGLILFVSCCVNKVFLIVLRLAKQKIHVVPLYLVFQLSPLKVLFVGMR